MLIHLRSNWAKEIDLLQWKTKQTKKTPKNDRYRKGQKYSSDHFVIHFGNFICIIFSSLSFSVVAKLNLTDRVTAPPFSRHLLRVISLNSSPSNGQKFTLKCIWMVSPRLTGVGIFFLLLLPALALLVDLFLVSSYWISCSDSSMGRHIHWKDTPGCLSWWGFIYYLLDWRALLLPSAP